MSLPEVPLRRGLRDRGLLGDGDRHVDAGGGVARAPLRGRHLRPAERRHVQRYVCSNFKMERICQMKCLIFFLYPYFFPNFFSCFLQEFVQFEISLYNFRDLRQTLTFSM